MSEQYIKVLHEIYKTSTIVVLPNDNSNNSNPINAGSVATALAIFKSLMGS